MKRIVVVMYDDNAETLQCIVAYHSNTAVPRFVVAKYASIKKVKLIVVMKFTCVATVRRAVAEKCYNTILMQQNKVHQNNLVAHVVMHNIVAYVVM